MSKTYTIKPKKRENGKVGDFCLTPSLRLCPSHQLFTGDFRVGRSTNGSLLRRMKLVESTIGAEGIGDDPFVVLNKSAATTMVVTSWQYLLGWVIHTKLKSLRLKPKEELIPVVHVLITAAPRRIRRSKRRTGIDPGEEIR